MELKHNWAEMGMTILLEPVQKQHGDHATDRVIVDANSLIAEVTDVEKFVATFGNATLLSFLNGTSLRVVAQRVARRLAENGTKDIAAKEDALLNAIKGIRASGGGVRTVTVKVYALPNGETFTPLADADTATREAEQVRYQAEYAAALVDAGVDASVALALAKTQTL